LVACVKYVESNSKKQKVLTHDRGELGGGG